MGEKMTLREVLDGVLVHVDGIAPYAEVPVVDLQAWADTLTARLTQPAQAVDVGAIASRLRGASDAAYCDYIRQLRTTECLGWESKVSGGKFGRAELDAHNRAHEMLGRHRALSEVVAILTTAALSGKQP